MFSGNFLFQNFLYHCLQQYRDTREIEVNSNYHFAKNLIKIRLHTNLLNLVNRLFSILFTKEKKKSLWTDITENNSIFKNPHFVRMDTSKFFITYVTPVLTNLK